MKNGFYKYTDDGVPGGGHVILKTAETEKSYIFKLIENTCRCKPTRLLNLFKKNDKAIIKKKNSGHPVVEYSTGFVIYPYQHGIPYLFEYIEGYTEKESVMQIYLLDFNEKMVDAWKYFFHPIFDDIAPVEFVQSDFGTFMEKHESDIDAVVSPANAYGLMDGGYDEALTKYFGNELQLMVQKKIVQELYGEQPVGTSISLKIPHRNIRLIHTPTMRTPSEIKDPTIIYQCMRTTLMEAINNNCKSVVIPAFGGSTGRVEPDIIAKMMYRAYLQIFDEKEREAINWGIAYEQCVALIKIERSK